MDMDEIASVEDFSSEAFIQRRDPLGEIVETFSTLYIDSEEENEQHIQQVISPEKVGEADDVAELPPPPALLFEEEQEDSNEVATIQRLMNIEEHLTDIEHRMSSCANQDKVSNMMRKLEDKLKYSIQREIDRVKMQMESRFADIGQSMVDCLKRRDKQFEQRIQALHLPTSTPISAATVSFKKTPHTDGKHVQATQSVHQYESLPAMPTPINPPVRLEFPTFTNASLDDPVVFIERVEEYMNLRTLPDKELLASLAVVLKGTAKDWWRAEMKNISTWNSFKEKFLFAFLNEDFKEVALQRLICRRQQSKESIRDFAYQYRALCIRSKPDMSEIEVVNAILRNCNPRLASLLRSSAKTVDELVRLGTQIEKDWMGAKSHWNMVNAENQDRKSPTVMTKRRQDNQLMLLDNKKASEYRSLHMYVTINHSKIKAIIDTGSTFSIIQKKVWRELNRKGSDQFIKTNQSFMLANGQSQTAIGKVKWRCELKTEEFEVDFFVMEDKDLAVPVILGLDFLQKSKMMLDFNTMHCHLPDTSQDECTLPFYQYDEQLTNRFYMAIPSIEESPTVSEADYHLIREAIDQAETTPEVRRQLEELMLKWPTVCTQSLGRTNVIKHQIITTDQQPIRKRPYKVSSFKNEFIEGQVKELLEKKIIQHSISPWASPVVVVGKKDGSMRLCVDYRGLNAKTHLDAYPMPQIVDILESLKGAKVFSTLDLKSGYWQMEMEKSSVEKTAFCTASGLYEFLCLPFGLKNSAASFQRLMEQVLREHKNKFCMVYIDDIVVFSPSVSTHLQQLQKIFASLKKAGLSLNMKKCNFIKPSLTFLGHVISAEGIKTDPEKISAVQTFPVPTSVKEVQRFLGFAGWYHRFIKNFSEKAAPLHALKKKDVTWNWSDKCQQAFETIKNDLITAPVLISPDFNRAFKVQTDASEYGLGAVLTQEEDGQERVVAYASRLLKGAEKAYSTSEKECLAVVWAIEKWRHYLEGNPFEVVTDHAALVWAFQHPKPSSRLIRWTIRLQGFHFTVRYRKGQCNIVPDVLSRQFNTEPTYLFLTPAQEKVPAYTLPVDLEQISKAQGEDKEIQELLKRDQQKKNDDAMRIHYVDKNGVVFRSVPDGKKGQKLQIVIPAVFRETFLSYAHDNPMSGHLGKFKTLMRLLDFVYWSSIRTDVWRYCKVCTVCQQHKPTNQKTSGMLQSVPVSEPGYMMGIDLMGPFPRSSKQNEYLLVIVDYFSKWVEMFPMRVAKAPNIAKILIEEIFTRWGTPTYLVSDRGKQFTSNLITTICKQWKVVQRLTTAYHPQTNLTERVNKNLKTMLSSYVKENHRSWDQWIPEFRFALNTAWHESTGHTPAEIALGRKLKGPLERALQHPPDPDHVSYSTLERQLQLINLVKNNIEKAQNHQRKYYNQRRKNQEFSEGDLVWVRSHPLSKADDAFMAKLSPRWKGPAKIVKRLGPVNYRVSLISDPTVIDTYHVQNLKICHGCEKF